MVFDIVRRDQPLPPAPVPTPLPVGPVEPVTGPAVAQDGQTNLWPAPLPSPAAPPPSRESGSTSDSAGEATGGPEGSSEQSVVEYASAAADMVALSGASFGSDGGTMSVHASVEGFGDHLDKGGDLYPETAEMNNIGLLIAQSLSVQNSGNR